MGTIQQKVTLSHEALLRKKPILVIYGPTGSGKGRLAVEIGKSLGSPIISADSRKVYKDMDIGTNKLRLMKYPMIYGINLIKPTEKYSVHDFLQLVDDIAQKSYEAGKLPIVVGGTALYITALLKNYDLKNIPPSQELRINLQQLSLTELQEQLQTQYPGVWNQLNDSEKGNSRRLIRWIEAQRENNTKNLLPRPAYTFLKIPMINEWSVLERKIRKRVPELLKHGLIEETTKLLKLYPKDCFGLSTMGYAEVVKYLDGQISYEAMETEIIRRHLKYAKYQLRWIKKFLV